MIYGSVLLCINFISQRKQEAGNRYQKVVIAVKKFPLVEKKIYLFINYSVTLLSIPLVSLEKKNLLINNVRSLLKASEFNFVDVMASYVVNLYNPHDNLPLIK